MITSKKIRAKTPRALVGWREYVGFPDLDIPFVRAKIDTGARTSALHATNLHHYDVGGEDWVRFTVPARKGRPEHRVEAPLAGVKKVTSSNGEAQRRFYIHTKMKIGSRIFSAEVTLTNRGQMGYAMLVGRTALLRRYNVDVAKSWVQGGGPTKEVSK
ncbi:ATP-dependent zinc protease [Pacificimonas sp. WHA3]|uniref:ATP-dependent zinc protease n=1 Tax=Pacificimonas pallii TaxID=2827236 RepID=A0ABS6SCA2_9SPHN|nr:RimK/LysX family protein [Pacificimonas pallii]MBV7256047.1 ATP-dependent zinc protease [Pacificimonas pallii]